MGENGIKIHGIVTILPPAFLGGQEAGAALSESAHTLSQKVHGK